MVSMVTMVIFLCEETTGANEYSLYKKHIQESQRKNQQKPANKGEVSFSKVDQQNSGQQQCSYRTQAKSLDYSDPLGRVVMVENTHRTLGLRF